MTLYQYTALFSAGDKVRVRRDLEAEKEYRGARNSHMWYFANERMAEFAGKIVTIAEVTGDGVYSIEEDDGRNGWLDSMFELEDADFKPAPESNDSVAMHKSICDELNKLYEKKNKDYGDSFHLSYLEEGMAMPRIRIGDKFNRFKTLTRAGNQEIKDESVRDTLIDLANYAIMTVMELEKGS